MSYTLGDAYTLEILVDLAKRIEDMGANSICVNQGYLCENIFNSLKQYYEKKTAFPPTNRNLSLLWIAICYIILTGSEHIDGPLILSIIISGALVFIPLLKYLKERGK